MSRIMVGDWRKALCFDDEETPCLIIIKVPLSSGHLFTIKAFFITHHSFTHGAFFYHQSIFQVFAIEKSFVYHINRK